MLIKLPPVHNPVLYTLANNTCESLLPAGPWHIPDLQQTAAQKPMVKCGVRALEETLSVWGKEADRGLRLIISWGALILRDLVRRGWLGPPGG